MFTSIKYDTYIYAIKHRDMKIYRSILLNEGEEIDTNNLGCSWTLCEIFAEDHAKDINRFHEKDGYVILEAEIDEDQIDWSNTLFAMEARPYEYEVVLDGGMITSTIHMVEGIDHLEEDDNVEGDAGSNNFEDYNDRYEGELTREDFLSLAAEF